VILRAWCQHGSSWLWELRGITFELRAWHRTLDPSVTWSSLPIFLVLNVLLSDYGGLPPCVIICALRESDSGNFAPPHVQFGACALQSLMLIVQLNTFVEGTSAPTEPTCTVLGDNTGNWRNSTRYRYIVTTSL
jgi:hypothetical protein